MKEQVLVAGGAGFLGKRVVEQLELQGYEVLVPEMPHYDLRYQQGVWSLFSLVKPEIVINLAASVGGISANMTKSGEFFYNNLVIGMNLMEMSRQCGVKKFVQMGSACEYPQNSPMPLVEASVWEGQPEETNAAYGLAKRALLSMGQAYRKQYSMNVIHLLPTNLYGPGDNFGVDSHFIPAMIRKSVETDPYGEIELWGTGSATRDFLYVDDAADGIVLAMQHYNDGEPVNLGSGREISIRETAEKIAWLSGFRGKIKWDTDMPDGQPRRVLDTSKAKEFGWEASTLLEAGLSRTIEWYSAKLRSAR